MPAVITTRLVRRGQAFNPHYGLFCVTPEGLLFPNPYAETAHPWQGSLDHLRLFEYLGRMVGKAIYEGILVELRLAPFFLRRMLGQVWPKCTSFWEIWGLVLYFLV
mmetsp:Transcript_19056/g.52498  ORF Transcript_19056/g.52498 Transcript_19056/m.52498 type:complete len:106 (+) Transcript_19056:149-466(+)